MKVLVVGAGGREHSLVWKLAQSPSIDRIYAAPGNAGIARMAVCKPIAVENIQALADFAGEKKVGLTVVGPEVPLTLGIVDEFARRGLTIFGPAAAAAQLEGSKSFCKQVMVEAGVPTAEYREFADAREAHAWVDSRGASVVVKADGLAAGKGVVVCRAAAEAHAAIAEIMERRAHGTAGDKIIIEELLEGEEASYIALTDGKAILPLATSQDHKAVFDNDEGPNTGGMGAYSPAPVVTPEMFDQVAATVIQPMVDRMAARGTPYRGVLYAGLMIANGKFKVLEFNARFGDPECQPLMFRMKSDLASLLLACTDGTLAGRAIEWSSQPACCVVMASGGYPGKYEKGLPISGLDEVRGRNVFVFHAGTAESEGRVVTAGGRVLGVTARGPDVAAAKQTAYEAAAKISWPGVHYRQDIADKAIPRAGKEKNR